MPELPTPEELVRAAWAVEAPCVASALLSRAINVAGGSLAVALKAVELAKAGHSSAELEAMVQRAAAAYGSHYSFAQPSTKLVKLAPSKSIEDKLASLELSL